MKRFLLIIFHLPLVVLFTPVLYLCTYLPQVLTNTYYKFLTLYWCKLFIRALGIDLRLIYKNKKPLPRQYILIANHPSSFEDFGIPACFNVSPLAKESVRHWFFLGRISERAGAIFFNRDDPASRHNAKDAMINALKNGQNIVLFPEGGCRGKKLYKEFKTGAFDASLKTGIPVIPLFLHYKDQLAFEWLDPDTLIDNLWQIMNAKNNRANYYVYDAIYPAEFSDKTKFANHVHALYLEWQKIHLEGNHK